MDLSDPSVKIRSTKRLHGPRTEHAKEVEKPGDGRSRDEEGRKRKKGYPLSEDKVDLSAEAEEEASKVTRGAGASVLLREKLYNKKGEVDEEKEGIQVDEVV